jgi:ribosomal protein S18 acetylase RimI-like enzyme
MTEIRSAEIDDLPVIRRLAEEIWPFAYGSILKEGQLKYMLDLIYSIPSLQHQLADLHHRFILVIENGVYIGFASFSSHEDPVVYHLNKIYILPGQQGKNIGKQILEFVISEVKAAGASSLQLNVNRHNKATHFYEKHGFKIIRSEDIDIGMGYFMNDYVMELHL